MSKTSQFLPYSGKSSPDFILKLFVVGGTGTGKSCLSHQFTESKFKCDSSSTVGIDFRIKSVNIGDTSVKLQIWDASGEERYKSIIRAYYRGKNGVLLVYDITSRESYNCLSIWLTDVRTLASHNTAVLLVGNKKDLEEKREVSFLEASRFAQENELMFLETSALTGENVEEAFLKCSKTILAKIEPNHLELLSIDRKLAYYYKKEVFTDADFHVKYGKSYILFSCHKLVLSLRSSYFAKKFYQEDHDSGHTVIKLSDVLPSTFEVLIDYCYGSNATLKQNCNDIGFLLKVFKAAKMYQITSLQILCIKIFMCTYPNEDNVFELLDAASLIESESLKLECYKILQTQTKHILNLQSIHNISRPAVKIILDMPSLSLDSEYDLISWLFEWASSQFAQIQSEAKHKQEFI